MTMDTLSLAGKTAFVTGSGREGSIGATIAVALARNGASVAIHYVSEQSKADAEKVAAGIIKDFGVKAAVIQGPLEKPDATKRMVEEALKGLDADHIDILVNNAGTTGPQDLLQATPDQLEGQFTVNVFGTVYMIQAVVSAGKMPKGGRIVNIGSAGSKLAASYNGIYAASKAAQDSLTQSWADVLGRSHGITINTLALGPIAAGMSKAFIQNADGTPTAPGAAMIAMARAESRFGTPEDVADATLLLVSEKSRWITAQWISVSGGTN